MRARRRVKREAQTAVASSNAPSTGHRSALPAPSGAAVATLLCHRLDDQM